MADRKHFNKGVVYGRVAEVKEEKTREKEKFYISFQVIINSPRSGSLRAFCRMYGDRAEEFLKYYKKNPRAPYRLQGIFSQYKKDEDFLSNFTIHEWEERAGEDRAFFVLRAEVKSVTSTRGHGQRIIMEYQPLRGEKEELELLAPGESMLEEAQEGQFLEVKGLLRQETLDDFYETGEGPVRAYLEHLKVLD